jgi:adenosylmethionine---8-amino-7-oxononanoate aminotransferase
MTLNHPARIWHPFTQMKTDPDPIHIQRGKGIYLYDYNGKRYIDAISSWWVNLHGHSHPVIAGAIAEQANKLEHVIFSGFTHDPAIELSASLGEILPGGLNNIFFSDNGSTSVEVALKLAVQYHVNRGFDSVNRFIAFRNAYHGDTFGAMSAGARSVFTLPFTELLFHTDFVDYPATWMGDAEVESRESECIKQIEILAHKNKGKYAAVIIEPLVQGAGGMNMCRPGFVAKLRELCNNLDILLICDEVMTGFGRTGHLFASNACSISPDLICLSKGITGGFLPLAVTVASDTIYDAFYSDDRKKTFFHGHSYTANPIACAAAVASIRLLRENKHQYAGLAERHHQRSFKFRELENMSKLRICGTIVAWQIKTSGKTGYLNETGTELKKRFLEEGILMRPLGDTLYLLPPYIITDEELDHIYDVIVRIMRSVQAHPG